MITFFPRNIQKSFLFARTALINTERVPPGFQFNMATISVKGLLTILWFQTTMQEDHKKVNYHFITAILKSQNLASSNILFDLEADLLKSNNKKAATFHCVPMIQCRVLMMWFKTEMMQFRAWMRSLFRYGLEPIRLQGLPVISKWM